MKPINATETDCLLAGIEVLVVEDFDDARDALVLLLEMYGAVVVATASATEALDAFDRYRFRIIVSDIGLPGTSGYAMLREIRRREATRGGFVPAIAVTAFDSANDRARARAAGFQSHLSKPFAVERLVEVMAEVVKAA
jgi:CheY-like chemotaxis protein